MAIIMLHYYAGSDFKTEFWEYAEERGRRCIENASSSFKFMLNNSKTPTALGSYSDYFPQFTFQSEELKAVSSCWWEGSFAQNKTGLGLNEVVWPVKP